MLTWAGHDLATFIVVVALWQALDASGGWVASLMLVVGKEEAMMWQCLSHGCCIWEATCQWGIWCFTLSYKKTFVAQLVRVLLTLL